VQPSGLCAAKTDFGRRGRRFLRYPNQRVALSAWPPNRRHPRRGHVGNLRTNEAHLLVDDIIHNRLPDYEGVGTKRRKADLYENIGAALKFNGILLNSMPHQFGVLGIDSPQSIPASRMHPTIAIAMRHLSNSSSCCVLRSLSDLEGLRTILDGIQKLPFTGGSVG
jgi:hypothetical protein